MELTECNHGFVVEDAGLGKGTDVGIGRFVFVLFQCLEMPIFGRLHLSKEDRR